MNLSLPVVSFDTETHLIQPGLAAPPLVVGSFATDAGGELLDKTQAQALFQWVLTKERILAGANIPFDMLVMAMHAARQGIDLMPLIFAKYEREEVFDVLVAEQLHAIAEGSLGVDPRGGPLKTAEGKPAGYSLETVTDIVLGRTTAKVNDAYRLRYAELEHLPLDQWPTEARVYPVDDAVNTRDVAIAQIKIKRNLHDLPAQVYTDFCMALGAAWGFHVNRERTLTLIRKSAANRDAGREPFIEAKILRRDGSQDQGVTKSRLAAAFGAKDPCTTCVGTAKVPSPKTGKPINCKACDATGFVLTDGVPRTETGAVSIARDSLVESGDEVLIDFAAYGEDKKILSTYAPWLCRGFRSNVVLPKKPTPEQMIEHLETGRNIPLTLRYNVLVETGRVSYSGGTVVMPRKGGVRECIEARKGFVLCSSDYEAGELVTHGQNCLWLVGFSKLAEALNAGVKVHNLFAAKLAGMSYDEYNAALKADKDKWGGYRQASKAANFGLPGGMGAPKLVLAKRKDPDVTTTSPDGRVYKGLRFCIAVGGERVCGRDMVTEWGKDRDGNTKPIAPTCRRCIDVATTIREQWFQQWPENREYFERVSGILRDPTNDKSEVVQHVSKRIRGAVHFTNAANGFFQGLLADAAKAAFRRIQRECCDRTCDSVLYGSRAIFLAHDETVAELREEVMHEAAWRQSEIMVEALRRYCPDMVPAINAEPALMRVLSKEAAKRTDAAGRLIPWDSAE